MAFSSSKRQLYGIQDRLLCRVCSEFNFDTLQGGFALPLPQDLISPGRDCRLCSFIISEWPRTIHALAEAHSAHPPRLILALMTGEADESHSQDVHEKRSRVLSDTQQIPALALMTDFDLRENKFKENGYIFLGKLAASKGNGATHSLLPPLP
jgi:hypothetical protein